MKAVILTGSSAGLGKAIFDILSVQDNMLICIARRFLPYQQKLAEEKSDYIKFIKSDLSQANVFKGVENSLASLIENKTITEIIFINNAAVIEPLGMIGALKNDAIIDSVNVNILFPALMTNYLLSIRGKRKIKIINITSGAADHLIIGWPLYCTTKAAIKIYFNILEQQEVADNKILVVNYDPGIMDSKMQQIIRSAEENDFPMVKKFINYKEEGKLVQPEEIARAIIDKYLKL